MSLANFDLTLLGTAASVPTEHRSTAAVYVRAGADQLLFDCGEGTQRQFMRHNGLADLDAIFLSHFHIDHWFGLPTLLKSFDLRERDKPLTIYAPEHLAEKMQTVKSLVGPVNYPIKLVEFRESIQHDAVLFEGYTVVPFKADHRPRCYSFAIVEDGQPGRLNVKRANELGVTAGPELGQLAAGKIVRGVAPSDVLGPPREGRRVVYSADTRPNDFLGSMAAGADVLVHEATFLESESARARKTGHSTARQAAQIAATAKARLTLLTHLSSRYTLKDYVDEVGTVEATGRVRIAKDFDTVVIPPKDKGEPIFSTGS